MLKTFFLYSLGGLALLQTSSVCSAQAQLGFEPRPASGLTRAVAASPAALRDSSVPDDYHLLLMIRGTIIAFNQANQTGNYTVLRDLGTPAFQNTNNSAKLAEIFAPLRARKVDLSPVMLYNPKLLNPPMLEDGQILRLTGFFPTTPEQINFDLAFQLVSDQWTLSGLAISTVSPSEVARSLHSIYTLQIPGTITHRETASAAPDARPAGEAKPIRIDLSETASLPPRKHVDKKPGKPQAPVATAVAPSAPPSPALDPSASDSSAPSQASQPAAGSGQWSPR